MTIYLFGLPFGPPTECFMFHARAAETKLPSDTEDYANLQSVMCVELVANRFLRKLRSPINSWCRVVFVQMVRVLVATAIREAAAGADDDALIKLMDATCRRATAPPAPPEGLCLVNVGYEEFKQEFCLIRGGEIKTKAVGPRSVYQSERVVAVGALEGWYMRPLLTWRKLCRRPLLQWLAMEVSVNSLDQLVGNLRPEVDSVKTLFTSISFPFLLAFMPTSFPKLFLALHLHPPPSSLSSHPSFFHHHHNAFTTHLHSHSSPRHRRLDLPIGSTAPRHGRPVRAMDAAAPHAPPLAHAVAARRELVGRRPRSPPLQGDAVPRRRRRRCAGHLDRHPWPVHRSERVGMGRRLLREREGVDAAAREHELVGRAGPRHSHGVAGPPRAQLQQQQPRGGDTGLHEAAGAEVSVPIVEPVLRRDTGRHLLHDASAQEGVAFSQQLLGADPDLSDGAGEADRSGAGQQQFRGEATGSLAAGAATGQRRLQPPRGPDSSEAQRYECNLV
ncbi:hypothetical protein B296_00002204 [Ensete ventricosum]|uniref:tRNA pseudouridine synthase n=1 Tax=Ensete ventricosum TaxID=4639 RepID=A0A427BAM8_ENSVE|nr:hypothetical protein B296_00002204 [Ensete ventricosum]